MLAVLAQQRWVLKEMCQGLWVGCLLDGSAPGRSVGVVHHQLAVAAVCLHVTFLLSAARAVLPR